MSKSDTNYKEDPTPHNSNNNIISNWGDHENDNDNDDDPMFDEYCSIMDDFGCEAYEDMAISSLDEKVYRWIRVEAKEDETLVDIKTKQDVLDQIEKVRTIQNTYGPCQLYNRQWHDKKITTQNQKQGGIIRASAPQPIINGEKKRPLPVPSSSSSSSFSVLQFNALAEGLSSGPDVKTPFQVSMENNNNNPPPPKKKDESDTRNSNSSNNKNKQQRDPGYGGFTQVPNPTQVFSFHLRRWRLIEVILGFTSIPPETSCSSGGGSSSSSTTTTTTKNNNDPPQQHNHDDDNLVGIFDILALEEIDRYRGFFAPILRIFGYEGIFMPKSKAPGVPLGYYSDGCALFWKKQIFDLVTEERIKYKVGNQVMILAELKHKSTGAHIMIAVTHLKAQKGETNEKIRCRQVEELINNVQTAVLKSTTKRGIISDDCHGSSMPVLILGDFNADPPAHIAFADSSIRRVLSNQQLLVEAKEAGATVEEEEKNDMSSTLNDIPQQQQQQQPIIGFQSAYEIDPPPNDFFTTWKTRGTNTVRRCIDYIFHSQSLKCVATLSIPKEEELEDSKLPGLRYPSDHLMVAAKYQFVIQDNNNNNNNNNKR